MREFKVYGFFGNFFLGVPWDVEFGFRVLRSLLNPEPSSPKPCAPNLHLLLHARKGKGLLSLTFFIVRPRGILLQLGVLQFVECSIGVVQRLFVSSTRFLRVVQGFSSGS